MSAFETAVADSKKLTSKPGNDDLLELYGACPTILYDKAHYHAPSTFLKEARIYELNT